MKRIGIDRQAYKSSASKTAKPEKCSFGDNYLISNSARCQELLLQPLVGAVEAGTYIQGSHHSKGVHVSYRKRGDE